MEYVDTRRFGTMPPMDLEVLVSSQEGLANLNHYPLTLYQRFRIVAHERIGYLGGQPYIILLNESTHDVIYVRWGVFKLNFAPEGINGPHSHIFQEWGRHNTEIEGQEEAYNNTAEQIRMGGRQQGGIPNMMSQQQMSQQQMLMMQQQSYPPRFQ
jgi:hypothetical protein